MREWLRRLTRDERLTIGSDIQRVQWRWPVSRPLVGTLGSGLYEVRSTHDANEYRVFFCVHGRCMVLLHGIAKKTQKTPARDLELARARQKELKR